jgi:hypothetical protein
MDSIQMRKIIKQKNGSVMQPENGKDFNPYQTTYSD